MAYFDDIYFDGAGAEAEHAAVHDGPASHYALMFVPSGQMYLAVDSGPRREIDGPFAFWLHPAHVYRYGPGASGSWHHYWVCFHGPRGVRIVEEGLMPLGDLGYVPVRRTQVITEAFARLVVLVREGDAPRNHPEAVATLEQLVALLWRDWSGAGLGRRRAEIEQVAAEVRSNPYAAFDFRAAAEHLHVSYGYFHRLFQKHMGRPPHDYLLLCRMREAAGELLDRQQPINVVASRAGYEDPSQFSKLFRKKIGMSPQEFRDYGGCL